MSTDAPATSPLREVEAVPGSPKPDPVIVADGVVRTFGGLVAVDVEHLEVQRGVITALIGPNGAGKTTFFNLLTGFDSADLGTRVLDGRELDHRYPLPRMPAALRIVTGAVGAGLATGLLAWLVDRAQGADSGSGVVLFGLAVVATLVVVLVGRSRAGALEQAAVIGVACALGVGVGAIAGAVVGPTGNWLTVVLWCGWLIGAATGLGFWRWATGPLRSHEVARMGMVRTFQLTKALSKLTVIDNMRLGATHQRGERFLPALLQMWIPQEQAVTEEADALLERFMLTRLRDEFAGTLSGGQRKLLEMARALMAQPSVVMLDEPMAGVNPALTQSLLSHITSLRDEGMTVVFVEHDMDVVREISDWVVVMAEGRIIAEGPPSVVGRDQRVIDAYLGAHHDRSLDAIDSAELEAEAEEELAAEEAEAESLERRESSEHRDG